MAKVLKEYVFGIGPRYPWDEWLDGQAWQLTQGSDFKCSVSTFRQTAAAHARQKGGRVRTHVKEKTRVVIQFYREANR